MKWERWHAVVAAAALAVVGLVAFRHGDSGGPAEGGAPLVEPARTPDDLLCDLYVSSPNASWSRLQRGIGGAVGILPTTLPGVLVALGDLDSQLASELDGTAPIYGALAGDPADPALALAIKLVDARRARGLLADGDTARFMAKDEAGLTRLVPKGAGRERPFEMAIAKNGYLVVTRRSLDLERLAPYVTRTLPARPLPAEAAVLDIPRSALRGALGPRIEAAWKNGKSFLLAEDQRMRAARGRAPDFGDPVAIVAALDAVLGRRVEITSGLERVRVTLDIADDAAVLHATLTAPKEDGPARRWIDRMTVGDGASVLALPTVSALAMSIRDGEVERAEQTRELEKVIATSLGPRLKQPTMLHDVIESMTKARDESFAFALGLDDPAGVLVRAPVRDVGAAEKAIGGTFDLARADPFKELFHVRDVTAANEEVAGIGRVSLVTVLRDPKRGADAGAGRKPKADAGASAGVSPGFGAAWAMKDEGGQKTLELGAGSEPIVTLKTGARPDRRLADEPSLARFMTAIGKDAAIVIVGQPLRLDPKRSNLPIAPLGVALGKKGDDAFVHVDLAAGLLREAARSQLGF